MYRRTPVIFLKRYRGLFVCLFSYFSLMVFTSYSLTYRLIGKKDPVAPQDEKKYVVFFSYLWNCSRYALIVLNLPQLK